MNHLSLGFYSHFLSSSSFVAAMFSAVPDAVVAAAAAEAVASGLLTSGTSPMEGVTTELVPKAPPSHPPTVLPAEGEGTEGNTSPPTPEASPSKLSTAMSQFGLAPLLRPVFLGAMGATPWEDPADLMELTEEEASQFLAGMRVEVEPEAGEGASSEEPPPSSAMPRRSRSAGSKVFFVA